MVYRLAWRPAPEAALAEATVPHLEPLRRAVRAGRDGRVRLPDGRVLRPSQVVSIAEIEPGGRVLAAWEVRRHGLDGRHDWRAAWRAVATRTAGLLPDDSRRPAIEAALRALDAAWAVRDPLAWAAAEAALETVMAGAAAVA